MLLNNSGQLHCIQYMLSIAYCVGFLGIALF